MCDQTAYPFGHQLHFLIWISMFRDKKGRRLMLDEGCWAFIDCTDPDKNDSMFEAIKEEQLWELYHFHNPPESKPYLPNYKPEIVIWVNLNDHYTEYWQISHCRYAADRAKLDTDLFEQDDTRLCKKGGSGSIHLSEVEYMVEDIWPHMGIVPSKSFTEYFK